MIASCVASVALAASPAAAASDADALCVSAKQQFDGYASLTEATADATCATSDGAASRCWVGRQVETQQVAASAPAAPSRGGGARAGARDDAADFAGRSLALALAGRVAYAAPTAPGLRRSRGIKGSHA